MTVIVLILHAFNWLNHSITERVVRSLCPVFSIALGANRVELCHAACHPTSAREVVQVQVEPWLDNRMWRKYVATPVAQGCHVATDRLLSILQPSSGGIMWRTSKNSVARELGIPEQEHVEEHLTLTAVEWHAYR